MVVELSTENVARESVRKDIDLFLTWRVVSPGQLRERTG